MIFYSSHKHASVCEETHSSQQKKNAYMPAAFLHGILQVNIRIATNYTKRSKRKNRTIYCIKSTLKSTGDIK
jgi:hypothetical protein